MPVIIKYVVERNGSEKMTFTNKSDADAYDKLLDTADALADLISSGYILEDPAQVETLAMFLANNKNDVLAALGNKRKKTKPSLDATSEKASDIQPKSPDLLDELVIEPDEDTAYSEDDISESTTQFEAVDDYLDTDAA
ncbi:hypothetical protein GV054_17175 [Marinomonas mediterranea]|jgi:Uncharacterized protein conserved in bacteria|uniref:YebG family protein n=1 Tax=Marinomonas mediterranea (strain ATCC 700492 / JCM 21426 / NBRC 103028 / MMB-1) TaxID=717774 RepID=F2K4X9_MARM1|nr:YebG family protein [Marinomonas mediterranea MMB-1]WCN14612.1 hypothetical protein GV054_17175 [Marinomonas mediterranea]WCN18659.1 hypothetical protein GV053_17240 [Marinomonas mediterranea MMB-1]